jgi:hypothetical protein
VELTNVPPELRVNASTSASPLQQNVDMTDESEKRVMSFANVMNVTIQLFGQVCLPNMNTFSDWFSETKKILKCLWLVL